MARKKTHEEFVNEIKNLVGDEYSVLGRYDGSKTKIEMFHITCGFKFLTKPNVFLTGCRCPKCSGKVRKDTEYFKREVFDLVGTEYSVGGEYIRTHTKVNFKHNTCGHQFTMCPSSFLSGQRCPKCQHGSSKKSTEEFKTEVYDLVGNEYSVLGEYFKSDIKIKMKHSKCGSTYMVTPSMFLCGNRCPKCFKNFRKTQDEFENEVRSVLGNDYSVIGEYKNMATKISIKHNICGHIWETVPRDIVGNKTHCPLCNFSKGEKRIQDYLSFNNIDSEPQKKFDDLFGVNKGLLSYDFYIPNINLLIEYQGEQHERFIKGMHKDITVFQKQKEHDRRKREYAKSNSMNLLEIWYYDYDNVEEILSNIIKQRKECLL